MKFEKMEMKMEITNSYQSDNQKLNPKKKCSEIIEMKYICSHHNDTEKMNPAE